jgi:hypothetical protein
MTNPSGLLLLVPLCIAFCLCHICLHLRDAGLTLTVVQRQMRHCDARTTLQKYGHVVGDAQRRAVNKLADNIERYTAAELVPSAELEPSTL